MAQTQLTEDTYKKDSVYPLRFNSKAEYDAWFRNEVEEGMRDEEEGRLISHDEVKQQSRKFFSLPRKKSLIDAD